MLKYIKIRFLIRQNWANGKRIVSDFFKCFNKWTGWEADYEHDLKRIFVLCKNINPLITNNNKNTNCVTIYIFIYLILMYFYNVLIELLQ